MCTDYQRAVIFQASLYACLDYAGVLIWLHSIYNREVYTHGHNALGHTIINYSGNNTYHQLVYIPTLWCKTAWQVASCI